MANKAPSTYPIWSLISEQTRQALAEFQKAQRKVEKAQRKMKKAPAKAG